MQNLFEVTQTLPYAAILGFPIVNLVLIFSNYYGPPLCQAASRLPMSEPRLSSALTCQKCAFPVTTRSRPAYRSQPIGNVVFMSLLSRPESATGNKEDP
jgi:hypothetical protein